MRDRLNEMLPKSRAVTPTLVAITGSLVTVFSLLANRPGWAIIIASLILPLMAVVELSRRDLFEDEPKWGALSALGWGALVGIIAGTLAAAISAEWWVKGATLHVGAGGFGGAAADLAGRPGFGVLLLNGILLPAVAIAFSALGPFTLRRYPVFRNEVMDGVTLGVASGCGLATGMAIVFVWPIVGGSSTRGDSVADWTALLTGVLVTRPIIFGLAVGFICAGIWHSSVSQKSMDLFLPAGIGLGGVVLFSLGDLLIQPSGTRWELLWHAVIALSLAGAGKVFLGRVITQDRTTQSVLLNRVICPNCGASTPSGTFCASCGASLKPIEMTIESEPFPVEVEPVTPVISDETEEQRPARDVTTSG